MEYHGKSYQRINGSVHNCGISIANVLEISQSCTKQPIS